MPDEGADPVLDELMAGLMPSKSRCGSAALAVLALSLLVSAAGARSGDAAAGATAHAATPPDGSADLWNDPEFKKQFIGSYGIHPDVEPRVSPVERDVLQRILPLMSDNQDEARRQLEAAAKPEASAIFDFTLGNIHFQQERMEEAAQRYELAVAKFPTFRRAHRNMALIRMRQGRFEDAVRAFSRVVELGGADALTFGLMGHAYTAREDYLAAESAYRSALLLQPDIADWRLGLVRCVLKLQKHGEAVALVEVLLRKQPERAELWLLQANAFLGLKEPLRAAENLEVVSRLGRATPDSLNLLGDIYVNEGLWDLAARAYSQAIERDSGEKLERSLRSVEALAQRGALPQARGLLADLRRLRGESLGETERRALFRLEARLAVAEGAGGEAVAALEELVSLDPLDGEALLLLGQHYAKSGEPDRAIIYYERAASLEPFEADARIRHAQALVGQSKYAEAVPLLKRAQELRPRDEIARYLEQVERVARSRR